jgi:aspartyl-tRNA(Asn)/glutamyl-tRNA(Gln) amidotransferase subunit A
VHDLREKVQDGAPPLRLGRLRGFFDRRAEPVMTRALDTALASMTEAGAEVIDLPEDVLDFETILRNHRTIMCSECAAGHRERYAAERGSYAPRISALIEEGLATSAPDYVRAWHSLSSFQAELTILQSDTFPCDALVMPATIGPAPDIGTTGDPAFNSPWSYLRPPAVSLPVGLAPDGMPLALQLVDSRPGRRHSRSLLQTAAWCEDVLRRAYRATTRSE